MHNTPHPQLLNLSGKTAIVTGGAWGIGFGIAYRLAEAGAKVVIADINHAEATKAVAELNNQGWAAKAIQVDVSSEEEVKAMVEETVNALGTLDVLVNNAGIYPATLFSQMTLADLEKVLAVNLKGVFLCCKYASAQMINQGRGGKIINITSIDALHPSSVGLAHYDASKHGVWGLTKNIALELAPYQISVNAIAPGGINTPGVIQAQKTTSSSSGTDMPKLLETFLATIPMHRLGEADEIGKVALFLASDMSSYMTGAQIVVDGGALLS